MTLQETIIQQLGVKPVIDPQEEIRKSIDFLKDYLKKHSFLKTYVLGISGGQDSTLAGRLMLAINLSQCACRMECRLTKTMHSELLLLSSRMSVLWLTSKKVQTL